MPSTKKSKKPPTTCIKCGSTKRSKYFGETAQKISGVTPEGRKYHRIVWRTCKCEECGQTRRDKSFE